jgi:hypothetical protein
MKKLNARKYIYALSDGTKFIIDEARRKAQIEAAGGNPNVVPYEYRETDSDRTPVSGTEPPADWS